MHPVEQRDEVEMLSLMLLIRRFEERASQQYQAQKIGGFCHLYIGQEAVVTGAVAAVRDDDYIITAYRDHAHALARGTSPDACMAELFVKTTFSQWELPCSDQPRSGKSSIARKVTTFLERLSTE